LAQIEGKAVTREGAEVAALGLLAWLGEAELLDAFMHSTGADLSAIRAAAADPAFLGGVVDFVMMDDEWVRRAAAALDLRPEALAQVRAALPGGDLPHWT
jgi:hypothetical protein